jgi:hypothetical protein
VQAAKYGININGSTLYCWSNRHHTVEPYEGKAEKAVSNCNKCIQVMKAAGIINVAVFANREIEGAPIQYAYLI